MSKLLTLEFSRRHTVVLGLAAAAGLLALGDRARAQRHTEATPEASPQATPEAGPKLLLRVEWSGGLMPMEYVAVQMPQFSLFDDGTLYRLGPTIAIYPPPALPNVTRMRVNQAGIDAIMERARQAGLGHAQSIDNTMVLDAPMTIFTYNDNGTLVKTTAYALIADARLPDDWDAATIDIYNNLLDVQAYLSGVDTHLPEDAVIEQDMPIEPDRLQIVSFMANPEQPMPSGVPDLNEPPIAWPLSTPLASFGAPWLALGGSYQSMNCAEISGEDATAVVAASQTGNFNSPWTDDGVTYGLLMRPLLPDEAPCGPMR